MNIKKKELKHLTPKKHLLINDIGIGSNRVVISNNYLNNFNYYNKNSIKMLELRKKKYLQNKNESEELTNEKYFPRLTHTKSYHNYNNSKTNNDHINNLKKGNHLKYPDRNNLQNLFHLKTENKIKINIKNKPVNRNINIFNDIISNFKYQKALKTNEIADNYKKKYYSINIVSHEKDKNNNNKNSIDLSDSEYLPKNKRTFKEDIKCKVIFGKNLSSDYKKRAALFQNERNKNKEFFYNKSNNNSNIMKLLKQLNILNFYNNISIRNINSDKEAINKDLTNISSIYKNENSENNDSNDNNENKQLNEYNYKNDLLPLIK